MTSSEKFCLKWNDFQENISSSFRNVHNNPDFSDVTLICEEDQQIEAHRVILSACSPFFDSVLRRNKHSHPLIYMRGIKAKDMTAIVDFIYCGEANIHQEDLDGFLSLAEDLKLKGWTGTDDKPIKDQQENIQPPKNPKPMQSFTKTEKEDYNNDEEISQNNSKYTLQVHSDIGQNIVPMETTNEDLEFKIVSMMESFISGDVKWKCTVCGKGTKDKCDMKRHIESHIDGVSHPCNICGKVSRSKNPLLMYKSRTHII